jgi:hypothetical protein
MQQPHQDMSGDYGYDLAHDDVRAGTSADSSARQEQPAPVTPSRPADPTGDLEYDESHDF